MEFNTHTKVEGNYVTGEIKNNEFLLNGLTSRNRTLPPFKTTYLFNADELGELINELQLVKNKIDDKPNKLIRGF